MRCPICKNKLELIKNDNSCDVYRCMKNHSFDVSKYSYVNLLINKSFSGDNKEMVKARQQFLNKNYYLELGLKIKEIVKNLKIKSLIDVGCGEGYFDRIIKDENLNITGLDISKDAILMASKQDSDIFYCIASAFDIPFEDDEFECYLSMFAPIDNSEANRITNKYLIKVIPNENHLLELKEQLYKNVYKTNILDKDINGFNLIEEKNLTYKKMVNEINELFKMTPYFYTTHNNFEVKLEMMEITFDFIIRVYEKA